MSGTREISWTDIEDLLTLTQDQSQKLLALLNTKLSQVSSPASDANATVADRRKYLAAMMNALPDQALSFLGDEQRARLKSLLAVMSQP